MAKPAAGFTLFEVLLGVVLLGLTGTLAARGGMALAGAVDRARRWSLAARMASSILAELERSYRALAPACQAPAAGVRASQGVRISWAVADLGTAIDIAMELRAGASAGATDSLSTAVGCR